MRSNINPSYGCTYPATQKFKGEYYAFTAGDSCENNKQSLLKKLYLSFNKRRMIQLFKKLLKRTPIYLIYLILRQVKLERGKKRIINNWQRIGKPIPPPHLIKQETVKEYTYKFSTEIFIETGTYHSAMILGTKRFFNQIYSIELDKDLYLKAKKLENMTIYISCKEIALKSCLSYLTKLKNRVYFGWTLIIQEA